MISKFKKTKINPMLTGVIVISLGVHILGLLIFGSITLVKWVIPDDAQFEEPPAIEEVEPPREVKVEIKPAVAPQKQAMGQLRMRQLGNIAVTAVNVDLPSMDDSFTVSAGLGGVGGGGLLGGTRGSIGMGMSNVNVFGLKSRAERVLFVIDASRSMLADSKGGLFSYRVIKEEISTMISNLSAGTLFNVAFYEGDRFEFFKPLPVPAGTAVTQELVTWIQPINADINSLGLRKPVRPPIKTLSDHPVHQALNSFRDGHNLTLFQTQLFLEQSVDAIFVITGNHRGVGPVRRQATTEEAAALRQTNLDPDYEEKMRAHLKARAEAVKKAEKLHAEENKRRAARGIPPKVLQRDILVEYKIKIDVPKPQGREFKRFFLSAEEGEAYLDDLVEVLYENKGAEPPSINLVIFLAGDEEFSDSKEDEIKDYVRDFSGKHRIIRGLNEIQSAATAAATTN